MNNKNVDTAINDCLTEFEQISVLIGTVGAFSQMSKFLTLYSIIKATGVLEYSYKTIVVDYHNEASPQIRNYLDKMIRNSSKNPSLDNISSLLNSFDPSWNSAFKAQLNAHPDKDRLKQSLSSLNDNRNNFAHGQPCAASFANIHSYFKDAVEIIKILDSIVGDNAVHNF